MLVISSSYRMAVGIGNNYGGAGGFVLESYFNYK